MSSKVGPSLDILESLQLLIYVKIAHESTCIFAHQAISSASFCLSTLGELKYLGRHTSILAADQFNVPCFTVSHFAFGNPFRAGFVQAQLVWTRLFAIFAQLRELINNFFFGL